MRIDGQSITFTAKGGPYETKCHHVYSIDLTSFNRPVSLLSSGIGEEKGAVVEVEEKGMYKQARTVDRIVSSTFLPTLRNTTMSDDFIEAAFCPPSLCDRADLDKSTAAACASMHEERYPLETPTIFFGKEETTDDSEAVESPVDYRTWGKWLFYSNWMRVGTFAAPDGIRLYFRNHSRTNSSLLFHGVRLPEDQREVAHSGILSLERAAVFRTTFGDLKNKRFSMDTPLLADPDYSLLNPKFLRDGSGRFFFTRLDTRTGTSSVWLRDGEQESLVRDSAQQMDTIRLRRVDYVTFVAPDKESGELQVFLATFGQNSSFPVQRRNNLEANTRLLMYVQSALEIYHTKQRIAGMDVR
ncbi:hypothetical protein M3Y99_00289300 [Aphelenchoides fujianensis]|nr:hypothetical protein M3Y99_00289300 [Aphelenchoides fujianensis]